jgi:hypothetical protein
LEFADAWVKLSPPKRLRNASAVAASGKQICFALHDLYGVAIGFFHSTKV